jgi:two-component system response regulator DegU
MLPLASVHIALLDDHALFRQGLGYILLKLPYVARVTEAATLPELLAICHQQVPDVLLLDLQMPQQDGAAVAPQLLHAFPDLKIIVLSMFSADSFVKQMMRLGARSYLPKDASQEELAQAIEEVLQTGYHWTPAMTRALTRVRPQPAPAPSSLVPDQLGLTRREQEVLRLICNGHKAADIAERLFINRRTVEGHWQKLLEKTGTHNVAGLVAFAVKQNLLG